MKVFVSTLMAFFSVIFTFFSSDGMAELKAKGDISGFAESISMVYDIPDLNTDENGDFTVLQFTDTHFTTGISFGDQLLLNKMEEEIVTYSPELVVVTGDMIDDGDSGLFNKGYVLRTVSELFEKHNQYWAYVPGNNDGRKHGSTADVSAYLSQYDHCIVYDDPEISGAAQYSIDIYSGEKLVHSALFIDTMDYDHEDDEHLYGYVHEDQVLWAEKEIASKKAVNPDVKVSVFMHENTPAFEKAATEGTVFKSTYSKITSSAEKYKIPKNQPLDDVFENSGSVGLVAIGHVHPIRNQCCFYNGTYYHIAAKTIINGTLITIHTNADDVKSMYEFKSLK